MSMPATVPAGLLTKGWPCRLAASRLGRFARVMMMASMRWASAAAAGACSAVLAASDWACGFGARMRVRIEKLRRRVA